MRRVIDHEYLFTVRKRGPKDDDGRWTWTVETAKARGMKGVAIELKCDINDIVYLNKEIIQ